MSKKKKSSQFHNSPRTSASNAQSANQKESTLSAVQEKLAPEKSVSETTGTQMVKPEELSLSAHQHIQNYLEKYRKDTNKLQKEDLNAVLRLSQHLRVFGLVSAVGYINQSNAQENNEVRKRTVPVWECLLGNLIEPNHLLGRAALMAKIVEMANQKPAQYMATWRKALVLANHWNFWARAYQEEK